MAGSFQGREKLEIQFEVKNSNRLDTNCVEIYAKFSYTERPPWGKVETKRLYAELYKVGDVIVWMHPFKNIPIHVLKTDDMDDAIEQAKEIISKHIVEKHSWV